MRNSIYATSYATRRAVDWAHDILTLLDNSQPHHFKNLLMVCNELGQANHHISNVITGLSRVRDLETLILLRDAIQRHGLMNATLNRVIIRLGGAKKIVPNDKPPEVANNNPVNQPLTRSRRIEGYRPGSNESKRNHFDTYAVIKPKTEEKPMVQARYGLVEIEPGKTEEVKEEPLKAEKPKPKPRRKPTKKPQSTDILRSIFRDFVQLSQADRKKLLRMVSDYEDL